MEAEVESSTKRHKHTHAHTHTNKHTARLVSSDKLTSSRILQFGLGPLPLVYRLAVLCEASCEQHDVCAHTRRHL